MKFYFAGSIRSGRNKLNVFIEINKILNKYGNVLDKHVASPNVFEIEKNNSEEDIYIRDINWIKECDILVAEASTPSLGVGYEIAYAESLNKQIICIYDENTNLTAMIRGNKNIKLIKYNDIDNMLYELEALLKELVK
ncbi:MAG: nucleoside 2-deoxyribosyltransferase [Bacilli bacterium]|nr:nucleoside 2-deoxyribosyltransferase [Bacilli bacterium]